MSWNPQHGIWSEETFDSVSGTSGSDTTRQNITGGYLTLIPQISAAASYFHPWEPVTGWTVSNSLNSQYTVQSTFELTGFTGYSPSTPTGYQQVSFAGGAWEVYTEADTGSLNSEPVFAAICLNKSSPDLSFFSGVTPTVNPLTIEVDVASTVQLDPNPLPGFTTGHKNLTGLDTLSGWLNHGIYLSVGQYWDFLECRPDGIRSTNHPELALPIDLRQPKRIRIGIEGNNLFILGENNTAAASVGKFNTVDPYGNTITGRPVIAFGAPRNSSTEDEFSWGPGHSGCAGHSYWDNIKVLTGDSVLEAPTGLRRIYTTETQSFYTAPFYPGFSLKDWRSAVVEFVDYPGGTTTITPQYESDGGYTDFTQAQRNLTGNGTVALDLTDLPVYNYVNHKSGVGRTGQPENAIRFKIDQSSTDGVGPAPAVDKITIVGSKEEPYLELIPNWKPSHKAGRINLKIDSTKFSNTYNTYESSSQFFFKPDGARTVTGSIVDELYNTGSVFGSGQYVSDARWDYSYQNYFFGSGIPTTGSEANNIFGQEYITNYVEDPYFNKGFKKIDYIDIAGNPTSVGDFGKSIQLPRDYDGSNPIVGLRHKVHRTNPSAFSSSSKTDYAQRVVLANTVDKAGIEVLVPGGILNTGQSCLFSCDLKMVEGAGIDIYATGAASASGFFFDSSTLSDYARISVPLSIQDTGRAFIGVVASTRHTGLSDFIIDNLAVSPYEESYLKFDNVESALHRVGIPSPGSDNLSVPLAEKASTCLDSFVFLDSYPTGDNVLFEKLRSSDGRGVKIYINTEGYPVADVDFSTKSWASGSTIGFDDPTEASAVSKSVTGLAKIPVGRWSHFGFIHQAHNFRGHDQYNVSGATDPGNLASSNRLYLTIDGVPVCSEDCLREWPTNITLEDNYAPGATGAYPSTIYVSDGTGSLTMASGLRCKLEHVHYNRPPSAEVEEYMAIRASRVSPPYFLPDVYLQPGHVSFSGVNANLTGSTSNSPGLLTHNVYNLDSPSASTMWDHGSTKNHLVFFGNVYKDIGNSPYNTGATGQWSSTRFDTISYGRNYYSSATDRLINPSSAWTGHTLNPHWPFGGALMLEPAFYIGGWVYPRSTGELFSLVMDDSAPEDKALFIRAETGGFVLVDRKEAGTNNIELTGTIYTDPLNKWSHVGFYVKSEGFDESWAPGSDPGINLKLYESGCLTATKESTDQDSDGFLYKGYNDYGIEEGNSYTASSAMFLGRTCDCSLADVFLSVRSDDSSEAVNWSGAANPTGVKGKGFTLAYYGTGIASGQYISGFLEMQAVIPAVNGPQKTNLWAGTNWYNSDEVSHIQGVVLSPAYPFKDVASYYYQYDPTDLYNAFGATDSPIRLGYYVPEHAVNIARVDTPPFSVEGSVSVIDLSDTNPNNLSTYRGGQFTLFNKYATTTTGTSTGSYQGINQTQYSGQADVTFNNQLDTDDLRLTSLSVAGLETSQPQEAYYAYLLGRGDWAVKISNAYPHPENGGFTGLTGADTNSYIENLEKVKNEISVRDRDGNLVAGFPWDIYTTHFSPDHLSDAVAKGQDIHVDGIGTGTYSGKLDDGVFSVIMVSPVVPKEGKTYWVYYPGYRLSDGYIDPAKKEIYNPIPIMRKKLPHEFPRAGQFSITVNNSNEKYYDLTVHGMDRTYTGYF